LDIEKRREISMYHQSTETIMINLLKQAVESEGCHLAEVDLENLVIKVDGADDVVSNCARAVAEVLD
jgi:phage tail tube protein FII